MTDNEIKDYGLISEDTDESKPDRPEQNNGRIIQDLWSDIGALAYQCIRQGEGLRLIAFLMGTAQGTGFDYGTAYECMTRGRFSRDYADGRPVLIPLKRGRAPRAESEILNRTLRDLINVMAAHRITPRRWCNIYDLDLQGLYDPETYELDTDKSAALTTSKLKYDFPEFFGIEPPPFKTGVKSTGLAYKCFRQKGHDNKIHRYFSKELDVNVLGRNNAVTFQIANKLAGLKIQRKKLEILLEHAMLNNSPLKGSDEGAKQALLWSPKVKKKTPPKSGEPEYDEHMVQADNIRKLKAKIRKLDSGFVSSKKLDEIAKIRENLRELGVTDIP